MTVQLETRNSSIQELQDLLQAQQDQKQDVVLPVNKLTSVGGKIIVPGDYEFMSMEGFSKFEELRTTPSAIFDSQFAEKFKVPRRYIVRARELAAAEAKAKEENFGTDATSVRRIEHLDEMFNIEFAQDERRMLVRMFVDPVTGKGIARSILSSKFLILDHLDMMFATLEGINAAGAEIVDHGCDLTDSNMRVKLYAPGIALMAPILLDGYKSPFEVPGRPGEGHGQEGLRDDQGNLPIVNAGLMFGNSETGSGTAYVLPWVRALACTNGMQIQVKGSGVTRRHLGANMGDGMVSRDTQQANIELIKLQARDAVEQFLDPVWVQGEIDKIEAKAGIRVTNAVETIDAVAKELRFSENERNSIMDMFVRSGQPTTGGVLNAVTAAAQEIPNPDRANEVEAAGLRAMAIAVRVAA